MRLVKNFCTRDLLTIMCWVIFIVIQIWVGFYWKFNGNEVLIPKGKYIVNIIFVLLFWKIMNVRSSLYWKPNRTLKCHLGLHECTYKQVETMVGTGRFIDNVEITRKMRWTDAKCKEIDCGWFDSYLK